MFSTQHSYRNDFISFQVTSPIFLPDADRDASRRIFLTVVLYSNGLVKAVVVS